MEEQESGRKKSKGPRILLRIVSGFILLLALVFFSVYILFNFFSTKLLREIIRKKVLESSQGLYTTDFSELKINILTRSVSIKDFSLIPDTNLYQKMKMEGKAKITLYKISYRELILKRLNFREAWFNNNLYLREMMIRKSEIVLAGFPDTITSRKGRFKMYMKIFTRLHPWYLMTSISTRFSWRRPGSCLTKKGSTVTRPWESTNSRQCSGMFQ